jgi:hypothetical protein
MATGESGGGVGPWLLENLEAGLDYERKIFRTAFGLQDRAEGMDAFLEKRDPVWKHEEGGPQPSVVRYGGARSDGYSTARMHGRMAMNCGLQPPLHKSDSLVGVPPDL